MSVRELRGTIMFLDEASVTATENAVIPYGVGVDIACRMKLSVFDIPGDELEARRDRLVSILQGSSDTTFYIIALYFGSVGITKTRYSIAYGLLADLAAVLAAIGVAYLFFH